MDGCRGLAAEAARCGAYYEAAFRDNEIDGAVLPKLTLDDLKDLGVAVVGHRRKIMSAIEELNAESVARTDVMEALPTQAALPVSASPDGAERRPITVMFCDLVGSTSLAAKLDAEDWRNLVNAYLDEASKAVTGFGGHVLKKLGDGLMALQKRRRTTPNAPCARRSPSSARSSTLMPGTRPRARRSFRREEVSSPGRWSGRRRVPKLEGDNLALLALPDRPIDGRKSPSHTPRGLVQGWPRRRHPRDHMLSGASAGQDDGMDFMLSDLGHFAQASKRRLHALVGWLPCIVRNKAHHRFKQRAHPGRVR